MWTWRAMTSAMEGWMPNSRPVGSVMRVRRFHSQQALAKLASLSFMAIMV
jgi:hypothetical protein